MDTPLGKPANWRTKNTLQCEQWAGKAAFLQQSHIISYITLVCRHDLRPGGHRDGIHGSGDTLDDTKRGFGYSFRTIRCASLSATNT